MRFRKRIKIAKGISLNLSKSGLSLTAGVRGASINIGSKGTYLNTGIPGTGIYDRKKIGKASGGGANRDNRDGRYIKMEISISINESGKPVIKDEDGNEIIDDSLLSSH